MKYEISHNAHEKTVLIESLFFKKSIETNTATKVLYSVGRVESLSIVDKVPNDIMRPVWINVTDDYVDCVYKTFDNSGYVFINGSTDRLSIRAWGHEEFIKHIEEVLGSQILPDNEQKIMLLSSSNGETFLNSVNYETSQLEAGNYMPDVSSVFNRVVEDINSTKPNGRIAIFYGPPGTGKTNLIKGIMKATPDVQHIIIPAEVLPNLSGPDLVNAFINAQEGRKVLIVEDADDSLKTRKSGEASAVSNLLNLTDGIIGEVLNVFVIATTNIAEVDIDPAIVRLGRLSVMKELHELNRETASTAYHRLTGATKEYARPVILAQVYADARKFKETCK